MFTYFTSDSIAEYEVTQGNIATNNVYRGLIIRNETVVYAEQTGYINYYIASASKAGLDDIVYSIDTSGDMAKEINDSGSDENAITSEMIEYATSTINDFSSNYNNNDFTKVYSFKEDLSSTLTQKLNQNALSTLSESIGTAVANNTFYTFKSQAAGIISYDIDGFEGVTCDNFTVDQYDATDVESANLSLNTEVNQLDPVYKVVTDENWNVLINISDDVAEALNDKTVVKVRFCDDDFTATVSFDILKKDGQYFLKLNFKNSMIRYIGERFTNIELVLNSDSGLKIPNSAITTKEFYTIPKEFFTAGNDSSDLCLMIKDTKKTDSVNLVTPTIFYETDYDYYIDSEDVSKGDVLVKSDSSNTYAVGADTDELTGVYNINKGYAVFKQINILSSNDDYTIVETKTSYGISLYDHIALDGSSVTENQTIVK